MPERSVTFPGRILFLTEDPELIRRQLRGEDLDWNPAIPLRDNISTDEITPGWVCYYYDETLGDYPVRRPHVPARSSRSAAASVKTGGFVASASRASGAARARRASSRRTRSWCAGVQLVIAENIEKIYRQNCQNIGLLTTHRLRAHRPDPPRARRSRSRSSRRRADEISARSSSTAASSPTTWRGSQGR